MDYSFFSTNYSILSFLEVSPIILFIVPIILFTVPIILIRAHNFSTLEHIIFYFRDPQVVNDPGSRRNNCL